MITTLPELHNARERWSAAMSYSTSGEDKEMLARATETMAQLEKEFEQSEHLFEWDDEGEPIRAKEFIQREDSPKKDLLVFALCFLGLGIMYLATRSLA